jgi:hypothetical protein
VATVSAGVPSDLATTTELVLPPGRLSPGVPYELTAIVAAQGGGLPTGTVLFTVDGIALPPAPIRVVDGRAVAGATVPGLETGPHTVEAVYPGGAGFRPSAAPPASLTIADEPAVTDPAPTVSRLERFGYHARPTVLVLWFSEAMDPSGVVNLTNYRLVAPGRDGRVGTRDDRVIRLRSASFDAATCALTLRPARGLPFRNRYLLTIFNGGSPRVADLTGHGLSDNGSSTAGDRVVLPITRANLVLPPELAARQRGAVRPSPRLAAGAVDAVLAAGTAPGRRR